MWNITDSWPTCRCREEDKDAYLYYILSVYGKGRTIVFCTSIAALRHISALLCIVGINVLTLHAQRQQRARLKVSLLFRRHPASIWHKTFPYVEVLTWQQLVLPKFIFYHFIEKEISVIESSEITVAVLKKLQKLQLEMIKQRV